MARVTSRFVSYDAATDLEALALASDLHAEGVQDVRAELDLMRDDCEAAAARCARLAARLPFAVCIHVPF